MKTLLAVSALALIAATPAAARLQLSISADGHVFTCFDGEASCDMSPLSKNLLTINTSVGGASVELTLAQSQSNPDVLQLSSSNIINTTGGPLTIKLLASDTGFQPSVNDIRLSGSLTFNSAVGSGASMLQFWANHGDAQGANPTNTPGPLLFTATDVPVTNPDSFQGTHTSLFDGDHPFSMTEGAALNLVAGASVTGFNESMRASPVSVVPESSTWAMMGIGLGLMGLIGWKRGRSARYAI